jgi:DUF971 family protein
MRPLDVQPVADQLAIKWDDGSETFVSLEKMRRHCPCASCAGETDIMGNVYKGPNRPLGPDAFRLVRISNVGGYALSPYWADGHSTGLFSYELLRRLGEM